MSEHETHEIDNVTTNSLLTAVDSLLLDGWRIIQILAISTTEGYEINYSFGGGYAMKTLRLRVGPKEAVPSITSYYAAAAFYENEMRDLFGVRIQRIHPDWHADLMGEKVHGAFSKVRIQGTSVERPVSLDAAPTPIAPEGEAK
jgi:NADH:ubiquinone oxidoreductase subunit C